MTQQIYRITRYFTAHVVRVGSSYLQICLYFFLYMCINLYCMYLKSNERINESILGRCIIAILIFATLYDL